MHDNPLWKEARSPLGLGTVALAGFSGPSDFDTFERTVVAAIRAGYGFLDMAPLYGLGRAEVSVGQILRTHGLRDRVILSTKVGRLLRRKGKVPKLEESFGVSTWHGGFPFDPEFDYSYDGIMRSVDDSMQRLGFDRFDILHIHDIGIVTHGPHAEKYWRQLTSDGGLRALDQLRSEGVTRAVGVGANETQVVMDLVREFDLDCCLVAGRYTLIDHSALEEFFPAMMSKDVKIIAAGVFNSGILGSGTRKAMSTYDYAKAPESVVRRVAAVEEICDAHNVALPEAALQFVTAHPAVSTIVLGCDSPEQVEQNWQYHSRKAPVAFWNDLRSAGILPREAPTPL